MRQLLRWFVRLADHRSIGRNDGHAQTRLACQLVRECVDQAKRSSAKDFARQDRVSRQVSTDSIDEIRRQRQIDADIDDQQQIRKEDRQAEEPFPLQRQFQDLLGETIADAAHGFDIIRRFAEFIA